MASTAVLECRQLSVSYAARSGDVAAVVDFDLTLRPGETHGLVGESGCGKSTIALAIMRHLGRSGRVVSGEIRFEGRNLLTLGAGALRRLRGSSIAMIYQEPLASLNPAMTLGEQLIEVPMCHDGASRQAARGRARSMLERVRLPDVERILRSYPHQISGGQQQRVVIAMALLANPRLLLLDEPTTALDVTVEAGIVDLIRELAAEFGTTMLYISHNLGLMRETCDRVTVMYAGEAVERGPVEGVFRAMRHPYTQGLFAAIPAPGSDRYSRPLTAISGHLPAPDARPPGCVFGPRCGYFVAGRCDQDPIAMHEVGLGHASRCVRVAEIDWKAHPAAAAVDGSTVSRIGGDPVLRVDHLSKYFEKVSANDDISFDAWRGETVAIVGESGCGKSTFAKILMGLTQATSGSIELADVELARVPVTRRSLDTIRSLQMIFQNPFDTLNPSRTVGAQIARAIRKFGGGLNSTQIRQRMLDLLDRVKLPRHFADRLPRQLSGGQKQRVGIARAFAGNPAFVVADEPLSALDVSVQAAVTEMLLDMQRRHRTTLLFISHDLSVVRYLADRVIVMYQGRIMEQGLTQEVFAPPYHPYTEALLAAIPVADPRFAKRKVTLLGDTPSSHGSTGCRLNSRCPRRIAGVCETVPPPVREFSVQHRIACHLPREELSAMQPVFSLQPIVEDLQ